MHSFKCRVWALKALPGSPANISVWTVWVGLSFLLAVSRLLCRFPVHDLVRVEPVLHVFGWCAEVSNIVVGVRVETYVLDKSAVLTLKRQGFGRHGVALCRMV